MRSIALVSEKGGVAKTTTVLNVAACLGRKGRRVLVVDTDPQANASYVLLGGEKAHRPALYDVLTGEAEAQEAIVPTAWVNVELLPAEPALADANVTLAGEVGRERRLRVGLDAVDDRFDYVLVDTAPTRSLLTTNVLNYVGELLVPIAPGLFSILGLGQLQADVAQVRRFLDNKALRLAGILLVMAEPNSVARDLEEQLRRMFAEVVFETKIPRSLRLELAHSRHEPIITYAPKSSAAAAYLALTEEILDHAHREQAKRPEDPGRDPAADDAA